MKKNDTIITTSDTTTESGVFWPILGHSQIKKYLQTCIERQTLAHAYIFTGPAAVGKSLTAIQLAATLLCQSSNQKKPCGTCVACLQLAKNIHPDVDIITRDPEKKNIHIQQIRQLQHKLSLRSFLTSYKIAIIDDAETMNEESANALLKTLEEPTPSTIIMLISEHPDWLPRTIISRCQVIQFGLIPLHQIENWLIMKGVDKKNAVSISHFANGHPGLAVQAMHDPALREQRAQNRKILTEMIHGTINDRIFTINQLVTNKTSDDEMRQLLGEWLGYFREMLLVKNDAATLINPEYRQTATMGSTKYSVNQLQTICQAIERGLSFISQSVNARLIIENISLLF